jgi:hypothetical protein
VTEFAAQIESCWHLIQARRSLRELRSQRVVRHAHERHCFYGKGDSK